MNIAEARERAEAFIFVFCDDASHRRRVAVSNFARIGDQWIEVPASRAAASGYVGTGRTVVDDGLPEPGWALEEAAGGQVVRDRHELTCRKCKSRPVPVREETLHAMLDRIAAAGESAVPLAAVAAILREMGQAE